MGEYSGYVGYVKLRDPKIENGVIGARQGAEILLAFDDAIRGILVQIEPGLSAAEFELPIKVREGSWEALIPTTVHQWVVAAVGAAVTASATTAATQLTKNSVKDKNFADVAREAVRVLQGVVRIAKHVGKLGKRDTGRGVRFSDNNETVEIPNAEGIYITTTRQELEAYLRTPAKLLSDIAGFLGEDSSFAFGSVSADGIATEEVVTYADRGVFGGEDDQESEEVVFPELKHDRYITLDGSMTRGNKLTNTIGFRYNGHILTCSPAGAPITAFRNAFFKDCTIGGRISRLTDSGDTNAKRPKIIFDKLTPNEIQSDQVALL